MLALTSEQSMSQLHGRHSSAPGGLAIIIMPTKARLASRTASRRAPHSAAAAAARLGRTPAGAGLIARDARALGRIGASDGVEGEQRVLEDHVVQAQVDDGHARLKRARRVE